MTTATTIPRESHTHGPNCGHAVILHRGHGDYIHDGHLDHVKRGSVERHVLDVSETNPAKCTPDHRCAEHTVDHQHGRDCGHPAVPHGDHVDYVVGGHLHHPCDKHCDDHGPVTVKSGPMHGSDVLVLIGDAQGARIVRAVRGKALDFIWEKSAPTRNVRGLNQGPDVDRNSGEAEASSGDLDGATQFVNDVSDQVRLFVNERPGQRLIVVAPQSFARALETAIGSVWPSRKGDVIYRDETQLDEEGVRHLIDATVDARPTAATAG